MTVQRGFIAIGVDHPKSYCNIGTLWRSAHALGAQFIFTIAHRYQPQASDTTRAWKHIPLLQFDTAEAFLEARPRDCPLIGIEMSHRSVPLEHFVHPERAVYVLGAEDHGLTRIVIDHCQHVVSIESRWCLNVAMAGTIALYDRQAKRHRAVAQETLDFAAKSSVAY